MRIPLLLWTTIVVGTASALGVSPLSAQGTCGTRDQGNYVVTLNPAAIVFPQPTASNYQAGVVALPAPVQITVVPVSAVGNNDWYVCVRSSDSNLGGYGKPLEDLQFYSTETSSWLPMSSSYTQLAAFSGSGIRTISLPMRMVLREDDPPGTYGPTPLVCYFSR